jgi:hypothetical protein
VDFLVGFLWGAGVATVSIGAVIAMTLELAEKL